MYYINIFFIYSFLGFLFENVLNIISNSNFNSSVLYGPWTVIYGIAILIIMVFNKFLKQFKLNKVIEIIVFYFGACIFMTLIEFSGGMLIEKIFHRVYWDYTNMAFNYGKYICLEVSLVWGLLATLVNYLVRDRLEKLAKKIPNYVTILLVLLFIIDIIVTAIY